MAFSIWLLSVAVSDLVGGLAGFPIRPKRALLGAVAAVVTCGGTALLGGHSITATVVLILVVLASTGVWIVPRVLKHEDEVSQSWASWILVAFFLPGAAVLAFGDLLPTPTSGLLLEWLRASSLLSEADPRRLLMIAAVLVYLHATSNAPVRLILTLAEPKLQQPAGMMRGGRVIGPLERLLVFGFALSGELAGAALIASAKSLLRFPEISSAARRGGDESSTTVATLTEYFLVGSLAGWLLALGPLVLFAYWH